MPHQSICHHYHTWISSPRPRLQWRAAATAATYPLQLAETNAFDALLVDVELRSNAYQIPAALSQNTYFWRVRARDAAGNWSAFAPAWMLTINVPLRPSDAGFTTDTTPTFAWDAMRVRAVTSFNWTILPTSPASMPHTKVQVAATPWRQGRCWIRESTSGVSER